MAFGADLLHAKLPQPLSIAQRTASKAAGPHAGILALQRTAGNRAVAEMLGRGGTPAVQRAFSIRPGDLRQHERLITGTTGTYAKISRMLLAYNRATDYRERLKLADAVQGLAVKWLTDHARPKGRRELRQHELVELLEAEARRETSKIRAEVKYLKSFPGGNKKRQLKGVNPAFGMAYADAALAVTQGDKVQAGGGTDEAAQALVAEYKLTAAEVAAIRTFTLPDYAYINPAVANSDSWLRDNLGEMKGAHMQQFLPRPMADGSLGPEFTALKLEGALHGGMLSQAVSKLPPYAEVTYRGLRENPAAFQKKYVEGATLAPFTSFSSASKVRAKAQTFADGTGGNFTPPPDKTVSVVLVVNMKDGRDISKLSFMGDEKEVLILPGAVFKVDRLVRMPRGNDGVPKATDWYTVFVTQVR